MSLIEKFKPSIHFSPAFGWINDPNGLVYSQGKWHLFYQYYPMSTVWGPMHWGHAISKDLVNWKHNPIALAPDQHGYMFSGSAIIDNKNVSGLFDQESENNLILYYTASMPRHQICPEDLQTQCLAFSKDGGQTWDKYEKNPILPNPDLLCYRDPKVVWVESANHWVMVLTHGQTVGIYKSKNLLSWEYCSEFGETEGHHSQGPWECPDLFPLKMSDGEIKWILIVGIGPHDTDSNYGQTPSTQYFIGDFDGEVFTNSNPENKVLWLDNGCDYYATQSYFNAPEGKRIGISWMSNWKYARNTDTKSFRGSMTLPKEFQLVRNLEGELVLAQHFFIENNLHFTQPVLAQSSNIQIESDVYKINATLSLSINQVVTLSLFGLSKPSLEIKRTVSGIEVRSIREYFGTDEVMKKEFPHDYTVNHKCVGTEISVDIIVDKGAVELLLDDGKFSMTQLHYPDKLDGNVNLGGQGWMDVIVANQKIK
ncbi:glycoside hydrolase family 32 protein [Vibrio misgurnus]|uniref:glycoside hydrolase family 32 protein n=1 Tax=Vibrio misgurnus TaxID=2993714 RepID=UPI0024180AD7|nr:glycoside hydrolase family 32 protein [Vibrio sp. gvc]